MRHLAATAFLLLLLLTGVAGNAQTSSKVRLLGNWRDTTNCPKNGAGQRWNDCWGFTVKGKEYAVIGGTAGAHIIDIDSCKERVFLPSGVSGVIHRDYKTYQQYLYCVADEGQLSNMQIYDISYLPDSAHLVWTSSRDTLWRSHNIFIDTAKARLYCGIISGQSTGTHDMGVYSLADPTRPSFLAFVDGNGQTHDMYVRNDTAWCSNSFTGYVMLEMSQLPHYRILGGLASYPFKGYNHSSWIGYDYIGVMADETFNLPVKVIDTRNPNNIQVLSTFTSHPATLDSSTIPHNPYIRDHYVFMSYYLDGLQIFDLSDPYNPRIAGYYDTYPGPSDQIYAGAWGCYPYLPSGRVLISDMQTGLYVFDVTEALQLVGVEKTQETPGVQIFPNPAEDKLSLQLSNGATGKLDCTVYRMDGAIVMHSSMASKANQRVDLSLPADLAPGLYMLRAAIGGQSFTARFTKR